MLSDLLTQPAPKGDSTVSPSTLPQLLYERNVELAIRNKTLDALRKMYEIMSVSLGVEETVQKLIEAIIEEMQFKKGFIALVHKDSYSLKLAGVSTSKEGESEILEKYNAPFKTFSVSLKDTENYCVKSVLDSEKRMTNFLSDIFTPFIDEKSAETLQQELGIETTVLFPIIFGGKALGVMVLCMDKHVGDLSREEREILHELIEVVAIAIERSQLYTDLKFANQRLEELDHLKDEFVSIASHELRTPMTAVKSYLWLILNDNKTKENVTQTQTYLSRAYQATERLINLVNDMLDVSRIESGRIKLTPIKLDINEAISQVYEELLPRFEEKKLKFIFDKKSVPLVFADIDKTKQVLINLIGNAIKFTQESGVITVTCTPKGKFIQVDVRDNGSGISPEDQTKLFQKFSRIEISTTTSVQASGTGLGLYICKQIIEKMGGKIGLNSVVGKGSVFSFTLPIVQ